MATEINSDKKFSPGIAELWKARELTLMLASRDFKVRYSQTFFGILWALIQPLFTLFIFILVFGKAIKINTYGVPYPVFALCGMLAWNYFSFVFSQAGSSIINSQSIITKIYFPKLVIPFSKTLVGIIDFGITLTLTLIIIAIYKVPFSTNIVFFPLFLLLLYFLSAGAGIWLSALSIRYRDLQNTIPFMVQLGLYFSPVAYPSALIPEKFRLLYFLNRLAGVVEGFRWCLIGSPLPSVQIMIATVIIIFLVFVTGIWYFRKVEDVIADII